MLLSYIYICVKNIAIFYVEFTKIIFSLFSLLNFSFKKIHKHPACKMNSDEQREASRKFEVLSEWPQSFFAATKTYILIFNLTRSLISLMGAFHFSPMENIFPNSLTNFYDFREWNISIIYFKFDMWSSSFMWILYLIFNSEASIRT